MTPKELAEKISDLDGIENKGWVYAVESIIAAALDEAIELERDAALPHRKMELIGAARAAYEDCAKIAQDESLAYAGKALLASDACADVAKLIRQRAKDLK